MRTCAEDESDAAKPQDYFLVGTLAELFKGPCKRGTVSIDNVQATNSGKKCQWTRRFVTIT